jgi:hypothetical protein
MDSAVVAAVIAASVSLLTLIVTVVAQIYGVRKTSSGTRETLQQLERTLAEQRTRTLNERFATAAGQLGSDKPPAVQMAGVYAMAGLADDWKENRQTCIDVLCAYLRMPYAPDPGEGAPAEDRLRFRSLREVRHTVIRVITAHLAGDTEVSWQGRDFDFTGVVFDGGDFTNAEFSGGIVNFQEAEFSDVNFMRTKFSAEPYDIGYLGVVSFVRARFPGWASFEGAEFCGFVPFGGAEFSGGSVHFSGVKFSGGEVSFGGATFSDGDVDFSSADFSGANLDVSRS